VVEETKSADLRGVTARSVIIGILLVPPNAYWIAQMEMVRFQGLPTMVSLFFNCIFILLCLTMVNAGLRRALPRIALDRRELLVIYVMLNIGTAIVGGDMVQYLVPQMSSYARNATPENNWQDLFFRYMPQWLYCDDPKIITGLYEGGDTFYRREYLAAWVPRILAWSSFVVVLLFMMLCINAIFRRRWMEQEKLSYPITHLPLEITRPGLPLFRNRMMWIGFAAAAAIDIINGLHEFWPTVPLIKVRRKHFDGYMQMLFSRPPWTPLADTHIGFYPFAIGLGLLLPTDLLFSCWFFYLVWRMETLLSGIVGWSRVSGFPFISEQGFGAYAGLALFALWTSRQHLAEVAFRVIRDRPNTVERGEPLDYRTAAYGLAGGAAFLLLFFGQMGLSWWIIPMLFGMYFLLSISVTRIRAELGPPVHDLIGSGADQAILRWFGSSYLGPRNTTLLGLTFWFNRACRSHPMPHQLEGYKMAQTTQMSMRRLSAAIMVAVVIGVLAAFWAGYHCCYQYGIDTKMVGTPRGWGPESFTRIQTLLQNPRGTDWRGIAASGSSLTFTLVLMALRMRFTWWPLHPVGYAVSSGWGMSVLWLCILIAWTVKVLTVRYGGPKAFQSMIPLALGLILGEFVIGSLWSLVGISLNVSTYAFWM